MKERGGDLVSLRAPLSSVALSVHLSLSASADGCAAASNGEDIDSRGNRDRRE